MIDKSGGEACLTRLLPCHMGAGGFGGILRLMAKAMRGHRAIYYGLWYPIVVAAMILVVDTLSLKETKYRDIHQN